MGQSGGGITLFSSSVDIIAIKNWQHCLDTKHWLFSGNAWLHSNVDHEEGRSSHRQGSILPESRIGLAAYPKHGLVHQVFFAAGDGKGGNHVPELVQLVQEEASSSLAPREFDLGTVVKYCTD